MLVIFSQITASSNLVLVSALKKKKKFLNIILGRAPLFHRRLCMKRLSFSTSGPFHFQVARAARAALGLGLQAAEAGWVRLGPRAGLAAGPQLVQRCPLPGCAPQASPAGGATPPPSGERRRCALGPQPGPVPTQGSRIPATVPKLLSYCGFSTSTLGVSRIQSSLHLPLGPAVSGPDAVSLPQDVCRAIDFDL